VRPGGRKSEGALEVGDGTHVSVVILFGIVRAKGFELEGVTGGDIDQRYMEICGDKGLWTLSRGEAGVPDPGGKHAMHGASIAEGMG
jgi:hypothetical protein